MPRKSAKALPHCPTLEENYLFEFWWVTSIIGGISDRLLVNAHKFNYVPPDEMDEFVEQAIGRLRQFQIKYRKQYRKTKFPLVR
jgi:hypothetical protein